MEQMQQKSNSVTTAWWIAKAERSTNLFIRNVCADGTSGGNTRLGLGNFRHWTPRRKLEEALWVLIALLFLFLCLLAPSSLANAQAANATAVSFGPVISPYTTISANAPYRVCLASATGLPCSTTGVTIYSDINLTHVLSNPSFANSQGIVNFFTTSGFYQIQLTPVPGQTYTYYAFPGGNGSPPSGLTVQTNSVNNLSQTLLNFVSTSTINFSNPSGGIEQAACNTTLAAGSIGCSFIPLFGSGAPTAACGAGNVSQEYYDLTPANTNPQIWICKQTGGSPAYAWQQLPSFSFPYPGAGVPLSTGTAWGTSFGVQGTDANVLTSGTVGGGAGSLFCTDAQGGATTAGCAVPPSITFEHNGSATGINQTVWNANDAFPAPPTGNVNVTWQHDQATGSWSAYVPSAITTTPAIDMQPQGLPAGQHMLIYPTAVTVTDSARTSSVAGTSTWQGVTVYPNGSSTITVPGNPFPPTVSTISWTFPGALESEAPFINPANITAIYAFTKSGWFSWPGSTSNVVVCNTHSMTVPLGPLIDTNTSVGTATAVDSSTCSAGINNSGFDYSDAKLSVGLVGLAVYYTGTAPPVDNNLQVALPLTLINNTLGIDPSFPQRLVGTTVAQLPASTINPNVMYYVTDYNGSTQGNCAGGGSTVAWATTLTLNAANWTCSPLGGGGGAVASVSNSDGTLTVTPTTGAVVASLALAHANTWTAKQTQPAPVLSDVTGSTQCLHVNSSGQVSGTGSDCGAGGGGVGGSGTAGFYALWSASTTLGNGSLDDGVTLANFVSSSKAFQVVCSTCATQVDMTYNSGHAPSPVASTAGVAVDSSGNLISSDNGGPFARVCNATNGVCSTGGGGGFPVGSVYTTFGSSWYLFNGYSVVYLDGTTYSCSAGTCTLNQINNFDATESIQLGSGTPSCLAGFVGSINSATPYQFSITGTTCGTTSGTISNINVTAGTAAITCGSSASPTLPANQCSAVINNNFSVGETIVFNPGTTPSCLEGRAFKAITGTSSTKLVVDSTDWGNCGNATGAGGIVWKGDTSVAGYSCNSSQLQWLSPFSAHCYNYALSDGNSGVKGTISSLVTNYTSSIHPIMVDKVTEAAGNPVIVNLYTTDSLGTATDESNFLTLAADYHNEGSNVQVWLHTIPPAVCKDPNTLLGNQHQMQDWQTENTWMYSQLSKENAPAAGKYFDRVISLQAAVQTDQCDADSIHLNNAGTWTIANIDNTEAGSKGAGLKQNSPSLESINVHFPNSYDFYTDGTNMLSQIWNSGVWTIQIGDPFTPGGTITNIASYHNYSGTWMPTYPVSACQSFASSNTTGAAGDTFFGRNAAGDMAIGTTCGGNQGGFQLTYLDVQATTAPTGSCTVTGRWEWAKDGTSAWCNGTTWQTTASGVTSLAATSPIVVSGSTGAVTVSCPTCSVGSGTNVEVNGGAALGTANLNATTPAAPGGNTNVTWQVSGSNVSAYVPASGGSSGWTNITSSVTFTGGSGSVSSGVWTSTATTTSIDISSIPSGGSQIRIVIGGASNSTNFYMTMYFNNDSGSHYAAQFIQYTNTTNTSGQSALGAPAAIVPLSSSGSYSLDEISLPFYSQSQAIHAALYNGGLSTSGSFISGSMTKIDAIEWWKPAANAAINEVTFAGGTFGTGITISVYEMN